MTRTVQSPLRILALLLAISLGACGDDEASEDSSAPLPSEEGSESRSTLEASPTSDLASTLETPGIPSSGPRPTPSTGDEPDPQPSLPEASIPAQPSDASSSPEEGLRIRSITPARGPVTGNTPVTIRGEGFALDDELFLGDAPLEAVDVVDEFIIFARTPAVTTTGPVSLRVGNAERSALLENAFTFLAPTELSSVEPGRAAEAGGTPVTIRGSAIAENSVVTFNGRPAIESNWISSTEIEALTPPLEAGAVRVRVTGDNGSAVLTGALRVDALPRLTEVQPGAGPTGGGNEIRILGSGLGDVSEVRIRSAQAEIIALSEDELRVLAPPGAPGAARISLTAPGGTSLHEASYFYFTPPEGDEPLVAGVVPGEGSVAGGERVRVVGVGLSTVSEVRFGASAGLLLDRNDGEVVVRTPAASGPGAVDVQVRRGSLQPVLENGFVYVRRPSVTSLNPQEGDRLGGTQVTFIGTALGDVSEVRFGPLQATLESVSETRVVVTTPPGSAGAVDVTLRAAGRETRLAEAFRYTQPREVFSAQPARGAIAGNTWVEVRGAGFLPDDRVFIGAEEVPEATWLDPSAIAIRTPPGEVGRFDIRVGEGSGAATLSEGWTYFDPFLPGGGWWGGPVDGALNVTVLDSASGARIPDAFVSLTIRDTERELMAVTNAAGQATVSGPGLRGIQTVHVTAEDYSRATVQDVNAENIVVFLRFICPDPDDPRCDGEDPPPPPGPGFISGNFVGIDKIDNPGPGRRLIGAVYTTFPNPRQSQPLPIPRPGDANVLLADGPYSIASRLGSVALVGVCGIHDEATGDFEPRFIGVARGLTVEENGQYQVDLDCNVGLGEPMVVRVNDSPATSLAAYTNVVTPYFDFGTEGYFGGLWEGRGRENTFTIQRLARLTGQLAGLRYFVFAEAATAGGVPYSAAVLGGVSDIGTSRTLQMPSFVPATQRVRPAVGASFDGRRLEWRPEGSFQPDFYHLILADAFEDIDYWEMWVPGDQTSINLPTFPPDAAVGPFPSGGDPVILFILAIDALRFDYDAFQYNDFAITNWRSWSVNGWILTTQ